MTMMAMMVMTMTMMAMMTMAMAMMVMTMAMAMMICSPVRQAEPSCCPPLSSQPNVIKIQNQLLKIHPITLLMNENNVLTDVHLLIVDNGSLLRGSIGAVRTRPSSHSCRCHCFDFSHLSHCYCHRRCHCCPFSCHLIKLLLPMSHSASKPSDGLSMVPQSISESNRIPP